MTIDAAQYIENIEGDLSPEQATMAIDIALGLADTEQSETSDTADAGNVKDDAKAEDVEKANADVETKAEAGKETDGGKPEGSDPENAVVLAKDGKHTIPYEKLVAAREAEKLAKAEAETLRKENEALKQAKPVQSAVETNATKQEEKPAFTLGDLSLMDEEETAKAISEYIEKQVAAKVADVESSLSQKLSPLEKQQQDALVDAHFRAIYEKHPDADSIAESAELEQWIGKQPSFAQAAILDVLQGGTAAQIVEVFDSFKKDTVQVQPETKPAIDADKAKAVAQRAAKEAAAQPPNSLTDIQGGKPPATSPEEALSGMNAVDMLGEMQGWSQDKIERYLSGL